MGLNIANKLKSRKAPQIKKKVMYMSIPACAFVRTKVGAITGQNATYGGVMEEEDYFNNDEGFEIALNAPINLPHNAVIIECIVHGNAAAEAAGGIWKLYRKNIDDGGWTFEGISQIKGIEELDNQLTNSIVDNKNFAYLLGVVDLADGEQIHGARITYTTDHII